ncbi:MAG: hypothetical protein HYU41_25620 [Candidatus Rokubacteria bacterium]|nr:hypothetical protein [Candidatus Rokubacteria bacterium]
MPLDYEELKRELERKRAAKAQPQAQPRGPRGPTEPGSPRRRRELPPRPPVEGVAAAITAALALVGIVILLIANQIDMLAPMPYRLGVAIGFLAAAGWAVLVFRYLQRYGEPRTNADFLGRVAIVVFAAIGCSAAAVGVLAFLNVKLDRGPQTVNRALVVDKARVETRNGATTAVRAASWWAGDVVLDFELPGSAFERIQPRQTYVVVRTRPGRFGWTWIEGDPDLETPPPAAAPPPVVAAAPPPAEPGAVPRADRVAAREAHQRGLAYQRAGRRNDAVGEFRQAIDIDPTFLVAYWDLDKALSAAQDFDGVIDMWTRFIEKDPDNRDAWNGRARARLAKKDPYGALEDAEHACRLHHAAACQLVERLKGETGR